MRERKDDLPLLITPVIQEDNVIPMDEMEKQALEKALAIYRSSLAVKKRAAKELNISLATLYNRIKKYKE